MLATAIEPFDGASWSWGRVAEALVDDAAARDRLTRSVLAPGYDAVFWETVPSSAARIADPYEQVVLDGGALADRVADRGPFADHFDATRPVVRFANLRGDARLVVPCPGPAGQAYAHLVAFLRTAPTEHVHQLWQEVGRAVQDWWHDTHADLWVSTAGLGVSWLHVRLDSVPKYYKHRPFREAATPR